MIDVDVRGLQEAIAYMEGVGRRAASDVTYQPTLMEIARKGLRYASSISPVVTGSYRGAHRVTGSGKKAMLSIDPMARNRKSGTLVTRYASAVEYYHQVYGRTASYLKMVRMPVEKVTRRIVK